MDKKKETSISLIHDQKNAEEIGLITAVTGEQRSRYLYWQLELSMQYAKRIDLVVSFLMESGVRMLIPKLKQAQERGVSICILTGNYLGITQPSALYMLRKELGDNVDLRFYADSRRAFHPKAYFFHGDNESRVFIGSSNVSQSALTSGIEWNYCLSSCVDKNAFDQFYAIFEDLFFNKSIVITDSVLRNYAKNWIRPAAAKDFARYERSEKKFLVEPLEYQPRGVQIEALYELDKSRKDGAVKGIVHAATGIGKTYLAAFDSVPYKRVLFVAHREEILKQAKKVFQNVRPNDTYGFFYGNEKNTQADMIFASVASLGKDEVLCETYFSPQTFDYIVMDECHHSTAGQYRKILRYFQPEYLLGLTATPERLDGKSVYELYDFEVPYELPLKEAVNKGVLVPFHYYGIFDDTVDYSTLRLVRGNYEEQDLNEIYLKNEERDNLILRYFQKYRPKHALGFCCSRFHAEHMAEYFSSHGVPAGAVYSQDRGAGLTGKFCIERETAVEKLQNGDVRVLFSVDMFNEGIDIPQVDLVMFLRPTESPTVFLQQLGRGLRKAPGKDYLNVLDFVGNYKKASLAPYLLSGERSRFGVSAADAAFTLTYPENCIVDFELKLLDLFRKMEERNRTIKEAILQEYNRVKELLHGRVPTRVELFTYMDENIYQLCLEHSKDNLFHHYLQFRKEQNDLEKVKCGWMETNAQKFLELLEQTNMQKSYKMPVLKAFCTDNGVKMFVTEDEVLQSWKEFYGKGTNWKDITGGETREEFEKISDKEHLQNIKRNPVNFLKKSGKGFFTDKEGAMIALTEEMEETVQKAGIQYAEEVDDIVQYRVLEYYWKRYREKE